MVAGLRASSNAGDEDSAQRTIMGSILDVKGVKNKDGSDVLFSSELLDALADCAWVYKALMNAFFAVQGGTSQAELYRLLKAKN